MPSLAILVSEVKRWASWVLVLVAALGVVVSYYGIYILLTSFASGLVAWASLALFISGPVGAVGAGVAWIKPRQRIAMALGLIAFAAWLVLWILMLSVFGFRFGT